MTLHDYLMASTDEFPEDDVEGVPSAWMPVATLVVTAGTLWAGDPWLCNEDDGCVVDVPNGTYAVEAQGWDFDGYRVIGRVRARLASARGAIPGEAIGSAGTDSGLIAICDIAAVDAAIGDDGDGFQDRIEAYAFGDFGIFRASLVGDVELAYVVSGFGDGWGPVYALMDGEEIAGIELDFLYEGADG